MKGYYSSLLAADRLRRCYEIASPVIKRYLEAEVQFVIERCSPDNRVLELGCGYGRALEELAPHVNTLVGIDTSAGSLQLARRTGCMLGLMSAGELAFRSRSFDVVVGIQNGISAFHIDRRQLLREAIRVTARGGLVLLSSYSDKFWDHRLEWFRAQAAEGLIGEIDWSATADGTIVCKDGFRAETVRPAEFEELAAACGVDCQIHEVNRSSVFCVIEVDA